jgi:hypothetical protein
MGFQTFVSSSCLLSMHMALRSSISKGSNYYFFGFTSSVFFKARNCYVLRVFFGLVPPIVAGIHTPSNS